MRKTAEIKLKPIIAFVRVIFFLYYYSPKVASFFNFTYWKIANLLIGLKINNKNFSWSLITITNLTWIGKKYFRLLRNQKHSYSYIVSIHVLESKSYLTHPLLHRNIHLCHFNLLFPSTSKMTRRLFDQTFIRLCQKSCTVLSQNCAFQWLQ